MTPVLDASDLARVFLRFKSDILPTGAVAEVLLSIDGGNTFDTEAPVFSYSRPPGASSPTRGTRRPLREHILDVPLAAGRRMSSSPSITRRRWPTSVTGRSTTWGTGEPEGIAKPPFHRGDADGSG